MMNNNDFELNEMRQQMETLKKKLDTQEIVNDRLVRRSMKQTVSSINRTYLLTIILSVVMVPYGYWAFVMLAGFSIAFWIGTSIFMLICASATHYNSRNLSDPDLMMHNLVETRSRMARAKKFDSDWLMYGIPGLILWLAWFFYEVYLINPDMPRNPFFWSGCIGGIIGLIIGFKLHFKTQREYQDIIDQIEDFTSE